jgi:hypothetical protein
MNTSAQLKRLANSSALEFAQRAAEGKSIQQTRSPMLVRADWVMQQIKQRQHSKTVQQLAAENLAQWREINPEWTDHGPELLLTSRGTPGYVVSSQGMPLGAADPERALSLLQYAAIVGGAYLLFKMMTER